VKPRVRRATAGDDEALGALFELVFGTPRPAATWSWLYREGPFAPGVRIVAEVQGRIVAHAGAVPRRLSVAGEIAPAGQSVDAMTHPGFRRQGLHRDVTERLFAELSKDGVPLLFGFTNEHSTPGALAFQGRTPIEPLPVLVRPLRPLRAAWHLLRSAAPPVPASFAPPEGLDALWSAALRPQDVSLVHDRAATAWRVARPGGAYLPSARTRGGALETFGAIGVRIQRGLRVAFAMEAMAAEDAPTLWRSLAGDLTDLASDAGCDAVCALGAPGTPERAALLRQGYVPAPGRLSPETLVLSARRTDGGPLPQALVELSRWRLRWSDHDVV
jgi:hypothetical protein